MSSSSLLGIIRWIIYGILVGTPLFYLRESVYPYTLSKTVFFWIGVELLVACWAYLIIHESRFRPRLTPATLGLVIFIAVLLFTALFGVDPLRSFWSMQDRMLGVFTYMHAAIFALVVASLKEAIDEKKIFWVSLGTCCFIVILAILQLSNPNLLLNESIGSRPGATFGNPSFFAAYLALHIFWALYYFLKASRSGEKTTLLFAEFFLVAGLFNTQTRGSILGLGVGLFVLAALFAWKAPVTSGFFSRRFMYLSFVAVFVLGVSGFWLTRTNAVWDSVPGVQRFRTISLDQADLQPRLIALGAAWQGFLERPVLGWGWENFNIVFNKNYDPKALELSYQETRFDKPHNYILELLVTGGAALFLAYLFFMGAFFLVLWRSTDTLWAQVITAGTISYILGNIFIFETLGALIIFYLLIGLTSRRYALLTNQEVVPQKHRGKEVLSGGGQVLAYSSAGVALLLVFFVSIPTLRATYYQYHGFITFRTRPLVAIDFFTRAIGINSPYSWNMVRDYAGAISEAYFYNSDKVPPEAVREAIAMMEQVGKDHPFDAYNFYALVDMYNQSSGIDPTYLSKAETAAARALELSPNRQQVIFSLAKTKSLQGKNDEALALVKKGLDLNPRVPDAHFYYGLLSFAVGDAKQGYESIEEAIRLGRKWKTVNEPLTVAGFYADAGHLKEAVTIYEAAKILDGENVEVKIKLGVAYYLNGERDKA
ncbi:MAG: O-antigen ligase family protein, partial [Patescibacteria group bacterium]